MQNYLEFDADFPDDSEWDQETDLLVPGGLSVCNALIALLREKGFSCSDVDQRDDSAWEFAGAKNKISVFFILQPARMGFQSWLLIVKKCNVFFRLLLHFAHDMTPPLNKASNLEQNWTFEKTLTEIDAILSTDARFSKIQRFTREEYEAPGNSE